MAIQKYEEQRPWGKFEEFIKNTQATVKLITVNPHEELSLQYHHGREEFWRVISGDGSVIVGDKESLALPGNEFFVEKEQHHQIKGGNTTLVILEIGLGHFDENDIIRLKDKYSRN